MNVLDSSGLYAIYFPNGKMYVGITLKTFGQRFMMHRASRNRQTRFTITNAIRKYYPDIYFKPLVVSNDMDYLKELEIAAIKTFQCARPHGYNSTPGGDMRPRVELVCRNQKCRKKFIGVNGSKFCSNPCKSAARRATGVDQEDRVCPCGATFRIDRHLSQDRCSKICARSVPTGHGRKSISFEGVVYPSVSAAAKATNRSRIFVRGHGSWSASFAQQKGF